MGNQAQTFGKMGSNASEISIPATPMRITRVTPSQPINLGPSGATARIAVIWADALSPFSQVGTPWRSSTIASSGQLRPKVIVMVVVAAMQAMMPRRLCSGVRGAGSVCITARAA